jgi:hypothetical protein
MQCFDNNDKFTTDNSNQQTIEMDDAQEEDAVHRGVVNGIARLTHPQYHEERRKLIVRGWPNGFIDRQSLNHLVRFLDNFGAHEVVRITGLILDHPSLVRDPSPDVGLNVLTDDFARSDTTLTNVTLNSCNFGRQQEASQLLAAFHTNRTVIDFIDCVANLAWTFSLRHFAKHASVAKA